MNDGVRGEIDVDEDAASRGTDQSESPEEEEEEDCTYALVHLSVEVPPALDELLDELRRKDRPTYDRALRSAALATRVGLDAGLTGRRLTALRTAALFHDLGKLALPERVLLSTHELTEREMVLVREHPGVGEALLHEHAPEWELVSKVVRWHHERHDGLGYPDGLPGDEIPLEARILAVVDAFASLTSHLHYRGAMSTSEALEVLRQHAGSQWEPRSVALLVREVSSQAS
jgi:HD-GYP domain-containing protein (c-di-GMP phosphodiesterase class II)